MNLDNKLPFDAFSMLDLPHWNEKLYDNKLKTGHIIQPVWDMPSLNTLDCDFQSNDSLISKKLKDLYSANRVVSATALTPEKQEKAEAETVDDSEMQIKMDFCRKLGYTSEEISAVLQKLGANADTNAVLGELVKHAPAAVETEAVPEVPSEYCLVPRGGGSTPSPAPVVAPEESEGKQLKPVVIDGSNVAMR